VWQIWEQSPDAAGLPRGPIKTLIFLGFAFLFLQTLAELIRLGSVLAGKAAAESIEAPSGLEEILADQADLDLGRK
jgi:TRAP-type mannitol/chloroaromatic compound transport system permease small subunit